MACRAETRCHVDPAVDQGSVSGFRVECTRCTQQSQALQHEVKNGITLVLRYEVENCHNVRQALQHEVRNCITLVLRHEVENCHTVTPEDRYGEWGGDGSMV